MKNRITAFVCALLCALCLLLPDTAAAGKRLKGSGRTVSRELTVEQSYDAVYASRAVRVRLVEGRPSDLIRIDADDNVVDKVTVEVKEKRLHLSIDPAYTSLSNLHVTITVPTDGRLSKLRATSAARITAGPAIRSQKVRFYASSAGRIDADIDALKSELEASSSARITAEVKGRSCDIDASSAARIDATLAVEQVDVDASSASKVNLKGAVLKADVEASSASSVNASELAAKHASIDTSSASSASIHCLERLDAEASSGSSIRYAGSCRSTDLKRSSGGSIRRK